MSSSFTVVYCCYFERSKVAHAEKDGLCFEQPMVAVRRTLLYLRVNVLSKMGRAASQKSYEVLIHVTASVISILLSFPLYTL